MAFKSTTRDTDKGYRRVMDTIRKLKELKPQAVAGVTGHRGAAAKPKGKGKSKSKVTVLDVAIFNEFGTSTIPERSFVREPFDRNRQKYGRYIKAAVTRNIIQAAQRNIRPVTEPFERLGLMMAGDMKRAISAGIPPENAKSTVSNKGSDTPLVDTGNLRQAISSEVRTTKNKKDDAAPSSDGSQAQQPPRAQGSNGSSSK